MYAHDVPIYTNDEVDIPRGDDVDSCNDPVTDWNRRKRHEINVEAYERVAADRLDGVEAKESSRDSLYCYSGGGGARRA